VTKSLCSQRQHDCKLYIVEDKIPFGHLEIHQAQIEEVYRDIVRVPESDRVDSHGRPIEEGRICKIKTGSKETYVIVRGAVSLSLVKNCRSNSSVKPFA
jgi:hypothetical protein